jgi:hypothetical protein
VSSQFPDNIIRALAAVVIIAAVIGFGVVYGALTTIAKEQWPDW